MSGLPVPLDIVFFVLVAIVLGWRLFIVLGRRINVDAVVTFQGRTLIGRKSLPLPDVAMPEVVTRIDIPQPSTRVGQALQQMALRSDRFKPAEFPGHAEKLFRDVVAAFAQGDLTALKSSLLPEALPPLQEVIEGRTALKQFQKTEIVSVEEIAIEGAFFSTAENQAEMAVIDVKFVSRQISTTYEENRSIASGTESVTEFSELWRFVNSGLPDLPPEGWRIAAIRPA